MKWTLFVSTAAAFAITTSFALPATTFERRATTELCGQWDIKEIGDYIVYNNLWNQAKATSGSQCTKITGLSGNNLAWSASWSWDGTNYDVKSYPNVKYKPVESNPKAISAITSIPFTWKWSYSGDNLITDVAFDLWTASSATGNYEYEVMIWLAAIGGAGPLGSQIGSFYYDSNRWKLYKGSNGSQTVYSFIAEKSIKDMSSDALPFLQHLVDSGYFANSQYLRNIQAGTEPFIGSNAVFKTTAYSVLVE